MGDYDGDGDPDLFLVNYGEKALLYRNDYANTTGQRWLILNLQGAGAPLSNRDGIGAKIKLTTPDGVSQYRETHSGTSLGGGDDLAACFGLSNNSIVSQVEVTWPSGTVQTLANIASNQRLTILEQASLPPEITVTSPNGRETWAKGTTHTITWNDNIPGNVKIKLLNGSATAATLTSSAPSNGSFEWTISSSLANGSKYKIEVSSAEDRTLKDRSDRTFSIQQTAR